MIKPIIVQGNISTTLHDFKFSTTGMKLFINGTHYTSANEELFTNADGEVSVDIQPGYEYEVWLCEDGIMILTKEIDNPESHFSDLPTNYIDRLAWFTVPKGTTTLDDIQINTIKIVEVE